MSLPDQSRKVGSKWDIVMKQLKESHRKIINKSCYNFTNEVQVVKKLHNSKEMKTLMLSYLNDLTPMLKKSSQLSEEIRSEGNKIYKRNDDANLFESVFLYTLALKCSESNNNLAFAHANRAAALMKLGFNKVARDDCEEAIKVTNEIETFHLKR
jgi:hypothetical protein